jgi:hypothetical protein
MYQTINATLLSKMEGTKNLKAHLICTGGNEFVLKKRSEKFSI